MTYGRPDCYLSCGTVDFLSCLFVNFMPHLRQARSKIYVIHSTQLPFNPASLFFTSSTSERPGSASFQRVKSLPRLLRSY